MPIMNLNLSVPPPNFNYPPSSVASHMNRSTNHQSLMYPPPSHPSQLQHLHILNNSYLKKPIYSIENKFCWVAFYYFKFELFIY